MGFFLVDEKWVVYGIVKSSETCPCSRPFHLGSRPRPPSARPLYGAVWQCMARQVWRCMARQVWCSAGHPTTGVTAALHHHTTTTLHRPRLRLSPQVLLTVYIYALTCCSAPYLTIACWTRLPTKTTSAYFSGSTQASFVCTFVSSFVPAPPF